VSLTDAVAAELPPAVAAWLAGADPRTVAHAARDVAAGAIRALWRWGGEPGHNPALHALLARDPSPTVRAVARDLGCGGPGAGDWRYPHVVRAVCDRLGLAGPGARRDVRARV
jgi:hypothetical protein